MYIQLCFMRAHFPVYRYLAWYLCSYVPIAGEQARAPSKMLVLSLSFVVFLICDHQYEFDLSEQLAPDDNRGFRGRKFLEDSWFLQ